MLPDSDLIHSYLHLQCHAIEIMPTSLCWSSEIDFCLSKKKIDFLDLKS